MNMYLMNLLTSLYQLVVGFVLGPIMLELQFVNNDPSSQGPGLFPHPPTIPVPVPVPSTSLLDSSTGNSASAAAALTAAALYSALSSSSSAASAAHLSSTAAFGPSPVSSVPLVNAIASAQSLNHHPFQSLPSPLDERLGAGGTDTVSRNLLTNLNRGFKCLMGQNSEFADVCAVRASPHQRISPLTCFIIRT